MEVFLNFLSPSIKHPVACMINNSVFRKLLELGSYVPPPINSMCS